MIIEIDPTTTQDIATFALTKQYNLQTARVTIANTAWTEVTSGGTIIGYTTGTVTVQPTSGTGIIYTDPSAIVAYANDTQDSTNYTVASDAGVKLTNIVNNTSTATYDCTFFADTAPTAPVVIDLLIYGSTIEGAEE